MNSPKRTQPSQLPKGETDEGAGDRLRLWLWNETRAGPWQGEA